MCKNRRIIALMMLFMTVLAGCSPRSSEGNTEAEPTAAIKVKAELDDDDTDNVFWHGLLAVEVDGKWGYINEQGEMVIEPQFDSADNFIGKGVATVVVGKEHFLINREGEQVGINKFDSLESLYENGYVIATTKSGNYGIVDETGEFVIERDNYRYEFDAIWDSKHGMFCIERNFKYGFMDINGNVVVEPKYSTVENFADNGLALVAIDDYEKYGFIDVTGKVVIDLQYDYAESFSEEIEGLAYVSKGKEEGYIDASGEMVHKIEENKEYITIEPDIEGTFDDNGLAVVLKKGKKGERGKYGMIDREGNYVIEPKFDDLGPFYDNGLACARINGKDGYIDRTGEFVIEPQFRFAGCFEENGLACVKVSKKTKYGYINSKGEIVIPPEYGHFGEWVNGRIWARTGNKLTLLSETGEIIKEVETKDVWSIGDYDGNVIFVNSDKKFVIINIEGEIIGEYACIYTEYQLYAKEWFFCSKKNCFRSPWGEWGMYCKKHRK